MKTANGKAPSRLKHLQDAHRTPRSSQFADTLRIDLLFSIAHSLADIAQALESEPIDRSLLAKLSLVNQPEENEDDLEPSAGFFSVFSNGSE
jgi:hypothetical protein